MLPVAAVCLCSARALADPPQHSGDTPPTPTPSQAAAKAADSNYIIGPGDTVDLFVWRNPELSVTVPVRPDGKISTPLVEDMVAVGKTASQLARDMEKVLSEYVRSPKVNISVKNAASAFSLVKVVGQVAHPQEIPYREGVTVLDAILAAGGLTQFASNRASSATDGHSRTALIRSDSLVTPGGEGQCSKRPLQHW